MNPSFEIIEFEWFGLKLQEPMALITNWILAIFSFYAFSQLKKGISQFQDLWRLFYLTLGISTIFGGLGHLLFQYAAIPGKFPSWSLGTLAGIFASFAMITLLESNETQKRLRTVVLIKSFFLLAAAIFTRKFLFIIIKISNHFVLSSCILFKNLPGHLGRFVCSVYQYLFLLFFFLPKKRKKLLY